MSNGESSGGPESCPYCGGLPEEEGLGDRRWAYHGCGAVSGMTLFGPDVPEGQDVFAEWNRWARGYKRVEYLESLIERWDHEGRLEARGYGGERIA